MLYRIILCLAVAALTACTTARMAKLPGLEADTVSYMVTQMPSSFSSKGDLVFGPYRASKISRGWITGKGSGWSVGKYKYNKKDTAQDYTYQFNGKSSWKGNCKASKGQQEVSIVAYGFYVNLSCSFFPAEGVGSEWKFSFIGDRSDHAAGTINLGSKKVTLKPVDKMEGSPFKLSFNTGYYFYLDKQIIAAVDVVSKEGPVWFNNSLSQDERDKIGMVAVAFLLNQIVFDN